MRVPERPRVIALAFLPPPSLTQLRRALAGSHQIVPALTWEELTVRARERTCDIIVVDPCAGAERFACERVEELAVALGRAPTTPVVGYVSVTAAAMHAVRALVRGCDAEIVVRGVDDGASALLQTLQRSIAGSGVEPLVNAAFEAPLAPLPPEIADAIALLFRRPDRLRSVDDLATAARTTRRTLDRWLARAGLAPARTLLACARVSAAFQLMSSGGVRTRGAAALLGYASPRALARELQWIAGFGPSTVPSHMSHAALVDALRPRLFRTPPAAQQSY